MLSSVRTPGFYSTIKQKKVLCHSGIGKRSNARMALDVTQPFTAMYVEYVCPLFTSACVTFPLIPESIETQEHILENMIKINEITDIPSDKVQGILMYLLIKNDKDGIEALVNALIEYNIQLTNIKELAGNVHEHMNAVESVVKIA